MHPVVTRAALRVVGVRIPPYALKEIRRQFQWRNPRFQTGSGQVRSLHGVLINEDVAERKGTSLQSSFSLVQLQSSSLWP